MKNQANLCLLFIICVLMLMLNLACDETLPQKDPHQTAMDNAQKMTVEQKAELVSERPDCKNDDPDTLLTCRMEWIIFNRLNDERIRNNLGTLQFNVPLNLAARQRACKLLQSSEFSHTGWQQAISAAGYTPGAENIVMVHRDPSDEAAERMYDVLYGSILHRRNMLYPGFFQIGVGICLGGKDGLFASQLFTTDPAPVIVIAPQ